MYDFVCLVSPFTSPVQFSVFPSKRKVTNILISELDVDSFKMRRIMHRQTQYEITAFRSKNDCFVLFTFKNVKHHSLSLFKVIDSLYFNSSRPPEAGGMFLWLKTPDRPPLDTGFSPVGYPLSNCGHTCKNS